MNKSVDVLEVMHSVLGDLMAAQAAGVYTDTDVNELSASIDAVAKLIDTGKKITDTAHRKAGGGWWMISNEDMTAQRTAIASVRGAA